MYVRPFVHNHRWDILLVVDIKNIFTLTLDLGGQLHASPYTCECRTPSCSEIIIFTALTGRPTPLINFYPLLTQPQPEDQSERERVDRHTDRLNDSLTSGTKKKRKKEKNNNNNNWTMFICCGIFFKYPIFCLHNHDVTPSLLICTWKLIIALWNITMALLLLWWWWCPRLGDDVVDDDAGGFGWCQRCLCGVQWCVSLILLLPSLATHVLSVKKRSGWGWGARVGGAGEGHMYVGTTWSCSCEHKKPRHRQKPHC